MKFMPVALVLALVSPVALSLSLAASAQTNKHPIHIQCTAENHDWIGARVCTQFRDEIARSPRYREVGSNVQEVHWNVHIVTAGGEDSQNSAQAIVLTQATGAYESYVTCFAQLTGANRVKEQVEAIFSAIDSRVQDQ